MSTEKTSDLLSELERLKVLLDKDSVFETKESQGIPLLTDVIDEQATVAEAQRQTVAVINVGDLSSGSGNGSGNGSDDDLTSRLRHQLRTEGRRMIRTMIDEELARVEARLNEELSSHLEQLLDDIQPVAETPPSPWEK